MKNIKFLLINNDFGVEATTDIDFNEDQDLKFEDFVRQLSEQLETGDTAWLEIEGLDRPLKFTVADSL